MGGDRAARLGDVNADGYRTALSEGAHGGQRGGDGAGGQEASQAGGHGAGFKRATGDAGLESSGNFRAAQAVHEMLLQSWSDPTKDEPGPIRVFPACPGEWKDVTFHDLRTEGAFLVSAERKGGVTQWVRIKSLAGEPCRVRPGLTGELQLKGERAIKFKTVAPGIYDLDLKKGEEVLLTGK